MAIIGTLNPQQLQLFDSNGYLVVESFASDEEIDSMRKRMDQLLNDLDSSTDSSILKPTDDYFNKSVEKLSFSFEEKAFDGDGNLKLPKQLSVKKVGHALHDIEPVFQKFSYSEKMSGLISSLGYKRPVIIQSMYIIKQPGIGAEIGPHQDGSFLYTEPPTCTGLWLALVDATIVNGCLSAIPGSQKKGLVRRFIRDENGVQFDRPEPSYDPEDFVPVEVKAGSLVIIHGDLIHQSYENQTPNSRDAYIIHVIDTEGCKWAEDNWMRIKVEPEPLYVS